VTRYSDEALLKGNFAQMLSDAPYGKEWNNAACDNIAEEAATEIAKHIFAFNQSLDAEKENLEVTTFSALGPMKVLGIMPGEADLLRVDGVLSDNNKPVSMVFHANQLSLTFTTVPVAKRGSENADDDDGLQIGFVIFDELKKRKAKRKIAAKEKKLSKAKRRVKKAEKK